MKTFHLLLLVLLCPMASVYAQLPETVFAYGKMPGLKAQPTMISLDHLPAYRVARKVFDRLVEARGDRRAPAPDFVLIRDKSRVAWAAPQKGIIALELAAYEVCTSFGPDSLQVLATLLAHELAHYYEKHGLAGHWVEQYADSLAFAQSLGGGQQKIYFETEADYLGGFLAYSAGFTPFNRMPEFLQRLYDAYGFPEDLAGYPTLAERKTLARLTGRRLQQLIERFEMANYLLAAGDYSAAHTFYRSVLLEYQSREVYNNAGVAALSAALTYFRPQELPFRYPVELDLQSRKALRANPADDPKVMREALLQEAVALFDASANLDPDYAVAFLNKANAYALLGDSSRARFYAATEAMERAGKNGKDKVQSDIEVLLGILDWQEGLQEKARGRWEKAAATGNPLAGINLQLAAGQAGQTQPPPTEQAFEQIGELSLVTFAGDLFYDELFPIKEELLFATYQPADQPGKILYYDYREGERQVFFHLSDPGYTGNTRLGICRGDEAQKVQQTYGPVLRRIETTEGSLLVYDQIIFVIDHAGKVERWVLYHTEVF